MPTRPPAPSAGLGPLDIALSLEAASRHRVVALAAVKALYPDASIHDALVLARWVVGGSASLTAIGALDLSERPR